MKRLLVLLSVVSLFFAISSPHAASPSPFPSGVTPGQFASSPFTPPRIQARVRQIPVRPGLANVANLQQMTRLFRFTPEQRQLLAKNGFVVTPGAEEQLFYVYENNDYLVIPSFVSTDTVLQVYHVFYDFTLRKVEQTKLVPELTAMARGLVELSERDHREAASPFVREAAKRNLAFATVTHRLMDPAAPIPAEVGDLVNAELALIEAHAGRTESPIFAGSGINVDYSQFVPRGHYTRTEELKRFFGAMMWLGLMPFPLENASSKEADRMSTAQALLLTAALYEKRADATPLITAWDRIYAPTAFYVGTADDLTPVEYQSLAGRVLGNTGVSARSLNEEGVDRFMAEARKEFRAPGIAASIGNVLTGAVQERQFRLMGQRFIIDSRVMQELTFPKVGSDDNRRLMASGLDVMAAFGSKRATALQLSNPVASGFANYESQLAKMTAEIAAIDQATWTSNLYWSWLWTLRSLLEPAGEGYPSFMRNQAWTDKSLSTALGSWAELKHDTVLYGKQSGAECGGGDEPPIVRGYVEPNVECYARLQHLTTMSRQGLRDRALIDEGDAVDSAFQEFEDLLGFLRRVSEKQLRNEALTRQEYDQIRYIGGQIERLTLSVIDENLTGWFEIESETDKNMAVIADVHTGGDRALQVGVGHADTIWVVAPIEGRLVLCRGAVFSYYEFAHPASDRLTDETWQGMLKRRPAPARPPWVRGFMSTAPAGAVKPSEVAVYSSGC